MAAESELIDVSIRPVRLTNDEYADIKRMAQKYRISVASLTSALLHYALTDGNMVTNAVNAAMTAARCADAKRPE
jgi:hypothetical protein